MKFGVNTFLFSSPLSNSELPLLKQFREWGFDCAELAIEEPHLLDAKLIGEALEQSELSHLISCGVFGKGRDLGGSPSEQQASIDYSKTVMDMMPIYHSNLFCGPLYCSVGSMGAQSDLEKQRRRQAVIENLKTLCRYAQPRGITIAMEVLNRYETDLINTCEQAVELIEQVDSPALKIHLDTFHMNIEESDFAAAIRCAGEHLGHVHASANHRGIPGNDTIPWIQVRDALGEIGYRGDIVIESFTQQVKSIARAASIWRDLGSSETIAREGLQHLKTVFAET